MPTALGVISLVVGAVGAGVQYMGAQSAARTQDQLALMNAQAQTQAITQQGQVSSMQAAINQRLAEADKRAIDASAANMANDAELASKQNRAAISQSRKQAAEFAALQRTSLAKGGFADITGSPLALLADTAEKSQMEADRLRFEDEQNRRGVFREISITRNQGVLAGINARGQRLSGLAAQQEATTRLAQSKLNYYSERASASAARTGAAASLLNNMGGLAFQGYQIYRTTPQAAKKP